MSDASTTTRNAVKVVPLSIVVLLGGISAQALADVPYGLTGRGALEIVLLPCAACFLTNEDLRTFTVSACLLVAALYGIVPILFRQSPVSWFAVGCYLSYLVFFFILSADLRRKGRERRVGCVDTVVSDS
jgi:hypothetical protein